jgi:hypothetical protein
MTNASVRGGLAARLGCIKKVLILRSTTRGVCIFQILCRMFSPRYLAYLASAEGALPVRAEAISYERVPNLYPKEFGQIIPKISVRNRMPVARTGGSPLCE